METVRIFRAKDFETAKRLALEIGRAEERDYENADGEIVRWRLAEILTLDCVGTGDLDGREIYARFVDITPADQGVSEVSLRPESSEPDQTGISTTWQKEES